VRGAVCRWAIGAAEGRAGGQEPSTMKRAPWPVPGCSPGGRLLQTP
jgi:hypothetical protein